MHINYLNAETLKKIIQDTGFTAQIDYVKPADKKSITKYIEKQPKFLKKITINLGWWLINSFLVRYLVPTYWIVATKI